MKTKHKKPRDRKPQRKVVETPDRSLSGIPVAGSQIIQATPVPKAGSEAAKATFADWMKQIFGTKDEELQMRMLGQAAYGVTDYVGRELKTFDHIAAALQGIAPRDALEGMLGVQMVAVHNFAMELRRRAALSGQSDLGVEVYVNRATKLLRMFTSLTEALSRYRGKVEQKMTVEHVHVYQGGRAIVGQVSQNNGQKSNRVNLERIGGDDEKLP